MQPETPEEFWAATIAPVGAFVSVAFTYSREGSRALGYDRCFFWPRLVLSELHVTNKP